MICIRWCVAILFVVTTAVGSHDTGFDEFNEPWKNVSRAIVIDPYEGNRIDWRSLSGDPRVIGIIHRASVGLRRDSQYMTRKTEAQSRGYKWGSYHLGLPGDPVAQADFYLDTVESSEDEVTALDIESLDLRRSMSLANSIKFLEHVRERTGRYPLLYANHEVTKEISQQYPGQSVFAFTGLWYARFKDTISDFPRRTWRTYTLWQFSSELNCHTDTDRNCPYRVPGTDSDMDVNVYNGSVDELRAQWPSIPVRLRQ